MLYEETEWNEDIYRGLLEKIDKLNIKGEKERQLQIALRLGAELFNHVQKMLMLYREHSKVAATETVPYFGKDIKCDTYQMMIDKLLDSVKTKIYKHASWLMSKQRARDETVNDTLGIISVINKFY